MKRILLTPIILVIFLLGLASGYLLSRQPQVVTTLGNYYPPAGFQKHLPIFDETVVTMPAVKIVNTTKTHWTLKDGFGNQFTFPLASNFKVYQSSMSKDLPNLPLPDLSVIKPGVEGFAVAKLIYNQYQLEQFTFFFAPH